MTRRKQDRTAPIARASATVARVRARSTSSARAALDVAHRAAERLVRLDGIVAFGDVYWRR